MQRSLSILLLCGIASSFSPAIHRRHLCTRLSLSAEAPDKGAGLDKKPDLFDAAEPADSDKPQINSGMDAIKLAATDPAEWLKARQEYDAKVAADMASDGSLEEGALTREDAIKYAGVLVVSFVGGRVFRANKEQEAATYAENPAP